MGGEWAFVEAESQSSTELCPNWHCDCGTAIFFAVFDVFYSDYFEEGFLKEGHMHFIL